jgi:diguanylate cyclase (GGDEF)-like protein
MKTSRLMIVLSGMTALAALLIVAVFLHLIQNVSESANNLDMKKTKQSLEATTDGIFDQAATLVGDNAKWDDAVKHSYGKIDKNWLLNTWGYVSADVNYDTVFIIDAKVQTIAAFSEGEYSEIDAASFFGSGLSNFIADLLSSKDGNERTAKFFKTPKGISVVAAAPIMPHSETLAKPSGSPRLLIFSKALTPDYLVNLGKRLALENLRIVSDTSGHSAFLPLEGTEGEEIGYLTWTPDNPGNKAKAEVQLPTLLAVAAMILTMVILTCFSGLLSSRLQRSEGNAWKIANRDSLTDLPNRYAMTEELKQKLFDQNKSSSTPLTVILADLDGFKEVNDTFGHQIGDQLLKQVAAGLQMVAKEFECNACRLGGDEFAVIFSGDCALDNAKIFSAAALEFLTTPFDLQGRIIKIGVSIGIATAEIGNTNASEILRCADVAMYTAKARGKNQFCHYEEKLDAGRNERINMAKALSAALKAKSLTVAYQPIVDASSHNISGVEALARWQMPNGEWARPDVFISVAEEFGLIDELGSQILATACNAIAPSEDLKLSVNISPAQFRNPKFVENCLEIIDRSNLPRNRLELEVTEGYMIDHQDLARPVIAALQEAGIEVSLDDFGTGYSSIGYLRQFQFNKLKIDRSLIQGMVKDEVARSIIQVTTVLARSMNMTVTAEGVEQEEEAALLKLAGCDTLQGYYFGRPQTAASIEELLGSKGQSKAA